MSDKKKLKKEKRAARKKAFEERISRIPVLRHLLKDFGLKALSLFFAIIVWVMVISQTNPTRDKMVYDVPVEITGLTTLNSRELSLAMNLDDLPQSVDVRLEVPMDDLSRVSADNVTAYIDFSRITSVGTYSLRLTLDSTYGTAVSASVESVSVDIESLTTALVPVQVVTIGEPDESIKTGKLTVSPTQFQITGPSTLVKKVAYAQVTADLTDLKTDYTRSVFYKLYDEEGNELDASNITSSIGDTVTINVPVYPIAEVPLLTDSCVIGAVREGYTLQSVEASPTTVKVAARQSVLDDLNGLFLSAVNVEDANETFSTTVSVKTNSDIVWTEISTVDVLVKISENTETRTFENVPIQVRNLGAGLTAQLSAEKTDIEVTLPASVMESFSAGSIVLYVDLNGLEVGAGQEIPVSVILVTTADSKSYVLADKTVTVNITKTAK